MRLLAIILSAGCLAVTAFLVVIGQVTQAQQMRLGRQQDEINRGALCQQVGANLLRDMGQVAIQNERMRDLLQRHGFTLTVNPNPPAQTPIR